MMATCPMESELHREYPDASPALRGHLSTCDACARQWSEIEALSALAREAPRPLRSPAQYREARALFVASALARGERRASPLFAVEMVALAAAAALLLLVHAPTPPEAHLSSVPPAPVAAAPIAPATSRGTIHAEASAQVTRRSQLPDEVIALADGKITVEVAPLGAGERFRVVTEDAEVEVRGTAFDVVSDHGHLVAVHVWHGRVEVRPRGAPVVVLHADERWDAPAPAKVITAATDDRDRAPARPVTPARPTPIEHREPSSERSSQGAVAPEAPAKPPEPAPPPAAKQEQVAKPAAVPAAELAFRRGWDELRANHPGEAATELERVPLDHPLAEDAMFWRGVALARSKRPGEAVRALTAFIARFPHSERVAEATALLGWQEIELGDLDEAEARFRSLTGPLPDDLKKNVEAGLAELHRRRAH
jgi:hypothetical protein